MKKQAKQPEIFMYVCNLSNTVTIGTRGVSEYTVNRYDFSKEVMRRSLDSDAIGREEKFKAYLKIAIELSQCIDFEEIKPEIKQLCGNNTK